MCLCSCVLLCICNEWKQMFYSACGRWNTGVFCFVFRWSCINWNNSALLLIGELEKEEEPEPLCHFRGSAPFFSSFSSAADNRQKNRGEMRGGKNRESEWESSRWDDIMCTAAELQQHWNKGSHSHTTMTHTCKTIDVYSLHTQTHTHMKFTWLPSGPCL